MDAAAWFWMILFSIAALTFFVIAAVVMVYGVKDLRDLLRGTRIKK